MLNAYSEMPISKPTIALTDIKTETGARSTNRNCRSDRWTVRIWSASTYPLVVNSGGSGTLVGQGVAFRVIGQTIALFETL